MEAKRKKGNASAKKGGWAISHTPIEAGCILAQL
jgi:hypothetical protein